MVSYQGMEIIEYILEALKKAGVKEVVAVKGYLADVLVKPTYVHSCPFVILIHHSSASHGTT